MTLIKELLQNIPLFTHDAKNNIPVDLFFILLIMFSINMHKTTNILLKPRMYCHGKSGNIYHIPKFEEGPLIEEEEIDFEQRSVKITFFKGNSISSPLLYHNCTKKELRTYIPCGALPSYREISTFYHLKNTFISPGKQVGLHYFHGTVQQLCKSGE